MTDSKSTDHWNFLARQLGAVPDTGPEEETRSPEPAEPAEPAGEVAEDIIIELQPEIIELQPEAAPAEEITVVSQPPTVGVPTPPARAPAPPRPPAPKPKARNHWRDVASVLGIEITEPEPEEPEVAEEAAPIDLPRPVAPPEPPAPVMRPPEPIERVMRPPEPIERDFDAGSRGRSDSRREHHRPSLFDDPDLSLDTPGVLDAVFDEIEPVAMAEPEEIAERRQPEPFEDEFESRDRFPPKGPKAMDDLFPDEAGDEEAEEPAVERVESEEAVDTDEEEKRARRRRRPRRRRRGGRRDQEPAEERVREPAAEGEEDEFEEEDVAEPRVSAAPERDSRAAAELDEDEELEDEDHFDGEEEDEDEEGSGERLKLKHKKIPTWQQAMEAIIAVNMESRAKNPSGGGGGGGRGRGRRWRK